MYLFVHARRKAYSLHAGSGRRFISSNTKLSCQDKANWSHFHLGLGSILDIDLPKARKVVRTQQGHSAIKGVCLTVSSFDWCMPRVACKPSPEVKHTNVHASTDATPALRAICAERQAMRKMSQPTTALFLRPGKGYLSGIAKKNSLAPCCLAGKGRSFTRRCLRLPKDQWRPAIDARHVVAATQTHFFARSDC